MRTRLAVSILFVSLFSLSCGRNAPDSVTGPQAVGPDQATATADTTRTTSGTDCAQYVGEDPPYDYGYVPKNAYFTKTWYIKNCGTNTWTTSYGVKFMSGTAGCGSFNFTRSTAPGATAPVWATCWIGSGSQYSGYFKVKNASGVTFGSQFYFIVNTY